uniref:RAB, member RAS oncogene family like 6 n=1 Tax=Leptobrachium leishanense TaxID=445787 RepID=A0A8C5PND9_9ANUR
MFSALKKLVGSEPSTFRDKNIPARLQSMNQSLQRRFANGVQYNMKIVIRGDRNMGKTTLWHRLQGKKFVEDYIPTQEIQVTSIHWNYKTTDDIVKVEVWDVVDKGKCKKRGESSLKLENDPQEGDADMAPAVEFLDVYKNCNGVILMFDITKQWTFNYIMRELPKVPNHVPVCVLGNYRDMGEHRVILPDDVRDCIEKLNRRPGSSYIHYAESSMKNSFGLTYLHEFFNIPFLQLQRETLSWQLETNQLDIDATLEELSVQQETEDQNYEIFLDMLETNKRLASPVATNGQSPGSSSQSPVIPPYSGSSDSSGPGTPLQVSSVAPATLVAASPPPPASDLPEPFDPTPPSVTAAPPLAAATQPKRGFMSRLFGSSMPESAPAKADGASPGSEPVKKVQSVEDFVPGDSLDRSFLEDSSPQKEQAKASSRAKRDSDGESSGTIPMDVGFQDDLDPDDRTTVKASTRTAVPSKNITLSSDEEDAAAPGVMIDADEDIDFETDPLENLEGDVVSKPPRKNDFAPIQGSYVWGSVLEETDSDLEGPIATQMLSFVMDDPDFDSEDSSRDTKKRCFPGAEQHVGQFRRGIGAAPACADHHHTHHTDLGKLFGLGFEEKVSKDNQEKDKESKSSKKKIKHKKGKEKEEGKEEKKKPKKRPEKNDYDELEAFLGGGPRADPRQGGKNSHSHRSGGGDSLL